MALAGYATTVSITGDSTAFANTVLTEVTTDTVFQMPSASQRILDPSVAITVQVDADGGGAGAYATVAADTYVVDYLNGTVTFPTPLAGVATVRMSGSYLALLPVAEARRVTIDRTRDELENTVFGNSEKRYMAGQRSAEGEIESLDIGTTDLDAGASTVTIEALFNAGTPKLLQVAIGTKTFRAWVRLFGLSAESSPSELVTANITWKAIAYPGSGQTEKAAFGMY